MGIPNVLTTNIIIYEQFIGDVKFDLGQNGTVKSSIVNHKSPVVVFLS